MSTGGQQRTLQDNSTFVRQTKHEVSVGKGHTLLGARKETQNTWRVWRFYLLIPKVLPKAISLNCEKVLQNTSEVKSAESHYISSGSQINFSFRMLFYFG